MIQKRSRFFFAFPIGQGDRACGARVLPSKAKMRQTLFASASSFFILLVPYPARSARRLPRGEGVDTGGTPFPSSLVTLNLRSELDGPGLQVDELTGRFFLPDFFCDAHGLCVAGEEEDLLGFA